MLTRKKESERHVEALLKALEILDCFETHQSLSLKNISEITGLNKSRIIRLCGTLESKRYLNFDANSSLYSLSSRLLSLGKAYERRNTLISLSRPILMELAERTGESVSLHVIDGLERLCLVREEGTFNVRYNISEGQHLPLYAGAGSKVLLCYAPEEIKQRVLKKHLLRRFTPTTITDPNLFEKEFEKIRRNGYAFSRGERDPDAGALAAPIFNQEKIVCAAMVITGPINRFSPENHSKYLSPLLSCAKKLSLAIGYAA
jgi:IclR family KDG regulon transcriptional repressor